MKSPTGCHFQSRRRRNRTMYEELVKSLRQCAEASCAGCKNVLVEIGCRGKLQREAADAIEGLSGLIKRYGGETGIKNLQEYANKYWDTLTKIPRWIPVTEKLPFAEPGNVSETVLVTDGKCVALAEWFNFEECEPYWSYTGIGDITHWMPLPEPPKEE